MGHLYHGYVSHNQRVIENLSIIRWEVKPLISAGEIPVTLRFFGWLPARNSIAASVATVASAKAL
jgi:hypothetical protein